MAPWEVDFDPLHDTEFIRNPLPALREAASASPIICHENLGRTYSVFSYDNVKEIFQNPDIFGSEVPREAKDKALGKLLDTLIAIDPPRHTRLRHLANRGFLPGVIKQFEAQAEEVVRERVDAILEMGEFDLVEDFSARITVGMITAILGLPLEDWPMIRKWTTDIANNSMSDLWLKEDEPRRYALTRRVTQELSDYFDEYLKERRRRPKQGDIVSALMEAEIEGDRLRDDEIEATAMLLLLAGNETTTNLITNFVRCMVWNEEQADRVRAAPELARDAIEETLRLRPSLRGTARRVRSETDFLGVKLLPGDSVFGWICMANRDPELFERPDEFDLARKPNRHMAFAAGPHVCLGAPLARMEGRIAAAELMARTKSIELLGEPDVAPNAVLDNILSQRARVRAL